MGWEALSIDKLVGMCRWMGSHSHDLIMMGLYFQQSY